MKKSTACFVFITLFSLIAGITLAADENETFEYNQEFEGLHITGQPFDLDPATYRLSITGLVETPLSLSFDEVKALEQTSRKLALNCPGFFTDIGIWSGVSVRTLLDKAGLKEDAKMVIFSTPDDSYRTRFPVSEAIKDDMIIAYQFNGKEFHRVHGFPLRLVAGGKEGSDWVKWLAKITVE
ncbi:MAG: molybdopterin-dependent oxidoreductase [Desulfofustis sp.]